MVTRLTPGDRGDDPATQQDDPATVPDGPTGGPFPAGRERRRRWVPRHLVFDVIAVVIVAMVFTLKIVNYVDPGALYVSTLRGNISAALHNSISAFRNIPALNHCATGLRLKSVPGGYVCVSGPATNLYQTIYRTYPLVGRGREAIYPDTDKGSVTAAGDLLRGQFDLPRYRPVQFPALPTWTEDPYHAAYWRYEFYALRPTLNLLYAFRTTGGAAYARQLRRLDTSFAAAAAEPGVRTAGARAAWADPQAVAFRAMALTDTWWKLRQGHQLPEATSTVLLRELETTGVYLANPDNYQIGGSRGTNEIAALYGLSVAFPGLPHAHQWLAVAQQRLGWQLKGIIGADGQLIDNSPYYDFYTLKRFWEIYGYTRAQHQPVSPVFASRLTAMVNFATYILQPDGRLPLLGASLEEKINDYGTYAAMAASDPGFRYAITGGTQGTAPPHSSVYFPASNLTVMRSGWPSGPDAARSTYLTFNVGRYRTAHSDLDALGLTLYGDGGDLLTDPGLYTFTPGPYRDYFHGTMSHNAVVVDGRSQYQGAGSAGPLVTKDGITYQSGESSLYEGVTQHRLVMMIDPDHILVVDQLRSSSVHRYQQMFHLAPGARLSRSGLTVTGSIGGAHPRQVTIQQLLPAGITESSVINRRGAHPGGLCSEQYGQLLPCYSVSYTADGANAQFTTLITIGRAAPGGFTVRPNQTGTKFRISDAGHYLALSLGRTGASTSRSWASDPKPPPARLVRVPAASVRAHWTHLGSGSMWSNRTGDVKGRLVTGVTSGTGTPAFLQNNAIRLNLSRHNARLRVRISGLPRVTNAEVLLSNDHWAKSVAADILAVYTPVHQGQWYNLFLGRSSSWGRKGGWRASAPGFNWSAVDGIRIEMTTRGAVRRPASVSTAGLWLLPPQKEGKLAIVFDDGYQSILPAAHYLHTAGMPANVAVIGKYVDNPNPDYLNVFQLRELQDRLGWDMVNHTQQHVDAVNVYERRGDITGYVADIVKQARWLEANGLNSAPNWFIYPHGQTDAAIERVVSRYYMFARTTSDDPDAYPYGSPHAVNDLEIQYPGDGEAGQVGYTAPAEILHAVRQAQKYHLTLILTFHRIHSQRGDLPGYPLNLFRQIVSGIARSGIKVMTFSQLDRSNGIPVRNHIYEDYGRAYQITVQISR